MENEIPFSGMATGYHATVVFFSCLEIGNLVHFSDIWNNWLNFEPIKKKYGVIFL